MPEGIEIDMQVSAYIPAHNSEATIRQSIASVREQSLAVSELIVIDDASEDQSASIAESLGARVVRLSKHMGRGAVRSIAIKESRHELVLSVDSSKALHPRFLEQALAWFEGPSVAAVCGRIIQGPHNTAADRWSGRHIFREKADLPFLRDAILITAGALIRKECALKAGGFDPEWTYAEDRALGTRLLTCGFDVIFDPAICVTNLTGNSLQQALERYWRWNASPGDRIDLHGYLKMINYSICVMAREDLKQSDAASIPISLLCPHYQAWQTLFSGMKARASQL